MAVFKVSVNVISFFLMAVDAYYNRMKVLSVLWAFYIYKDIYYHSLILILIKLDLENFPES